MDVSFHRGIKDLVDLTMVFMYLYNYRKIKFLGNKAG